MLIKGDEIIVEEMPQGRYITRLITGSTIRISSHKDAFIIINSLLKMIQLDLGYKNDKSSIN